MLRQRDGQIAQHEARNDHPGNRTDDAQHAVADDDANRDLLPQPGMAVGFVAVVRRHITLRPQIVEIVSRSQGVLLVRWPAHGGAAACWRRIFRHRPTAPQAPSERLRGQPQAQKRAIERIATTEA